ncbi:MAG: PBECR4 domain-containing protein [Clostridia bacterium]|nr:PBECR4 domain-containing protein [Clostridia bacterium]
MDLLKKNAELYANYNGYDYTFTLDCQMSVTVAFRAGHFHHLVGLHYLKDIAQVDKSRLNQSAASIYNKILKGKITQDFIQKSTFYSKIEERMLHFADFDEILSSKFIVDFDYTKVPKTELLSQYLLYKQYETGYAILGLKYDARNDIYIPETFLFEHSDYYIKDQISYAVIEVTAKHYKEKQNSNQ